MNEASTKKALKLAAKVRRAAEKYRTKHKKREWMFDKDLGGMCAIASMALVSYLRRHGIKNAKLISGYCMRDEFYRLKPSTASHCWVELPLDRKDRLVVDITQTQFKQCAKVYTQKTSVRSGGSLKHRTYNDMKPWGSMCRPTLEKTKELLSLVED